MTSTAGIQYQPLSDELYSIPKAQILFKPQGSETYELLGDSDEVTLEPTVEETERYTNEAGIRKLAKTIITQVDAEFNMTLVQLSDRNRALSLLGLLEAATQVANAAAVLNITAVETDGDIYKLDGAVDVTIVSVTDGIAAETYIEGTHYKIDQAAGFIQFIDKPAGADADAVVTYGYPDIIVGDERAVIPIASNTDIRGTLIVRGTNEVGPRLMLTLHDVQLRPSGARNYISETDLDNIQVTGRVFTDETQPSGYELGFEQILSNDVA